MTCINPVAMQMPAVVEPRNPAGSLLTLLKRRNIKIKSPSVAG